MWPSFLSQDLYKSTFFSLSIFRWQVSPIFFFASRCPCPPYMSPNICCMHNFYAAFLMNMKVTEKWWVSKEAVSLFTLRRLQWNLMIIPCLWSLKNNIFLPLNATAAMLKMFSCHTRAAGNLLTSHRNNKNTTSANKLAAESRSTSRIFQLKYYLRAPSLGAQIRNMFRFLINCI